jgi:hypothetical protein
MKRYAMHLLSLSAMLAIVLSGTHANAHPGKSGKGFKRHGKYGKLVQISNVPTGRHRHSARHLVRRAPPPRRIAHMRRPLRRGYTWIPGRWQFSYRFETYVWVDGHWSRTRPGRRWVRGNWSRTPHGWYFASGYWM